MTVAKDKESYVAEEGLRKVLGSAKAGFCESVDAAIRLHLGDAKSGEQLRGVVVMPKGIGREVQVAVFARGEYQRMAKEAGASLVGDDDLLEEIKRKRKIEVDWCVATPDLMPQVSSVARILGPRGLMPNPKFGTVTFEIDKMVKIIKCGQVRLKSDKNGIVHVKIGNVNFTLEDLVENLRAAVAAVQSLKPSTVKGVFFRDIYVSSTMGRSFRIVGLE